MTVAELIAELSSMPDLNVPVSVFVGPDYNSGHAYTGKIEIFEGTNTDTNTGFVELFVEDTADV